MQEPWCDKHVHGLTSFREHGELAVKTNNIDIVKWFVRNVPMGPCCMMEAVKTGNIIMVKLVCVDAFISPYASNWDPISKDYAYSFTGMTFNDKVYISQDWEKNYWVGTLVTGINRQWLF